ncbi:uncharacterized protein LOC103708939 [Phoenix dactylifera]|uniref:Uncharacterized protein LOC103708939 n=1 Tax=Phoenix dactylifera TaxID=42345 RepID=A0A8B7C5N3_PHODC|nr:uncharacterized protein LOC103708939 [Phoenix dactylifera]
MESKFSEDLIAKEVEKTEGERKIHSLERELGALRSRCSELEGQTKKVEGFHVQKEKSELENQIARLKEDFRVVSEREHRAQERIMSLLVLQKKCNEVDVWKRKCAELEARVSRLEEENSSLRGIKQDKFQAASVGKPVLGVVIEISDSEEEKIGKDQGAEEHAKTGSFDFKTELSPKKSSNMMHFDQRNIYGVEDDGEGHAENSLPTPTPKRKRAVRVVTSDSESDDNDDNIPIAKLKMRFGAMAQGIKQQCDAIQEAVTPSRRRLVPLRVRDKRDAGAKESSSGDLAAQRVTPDKKDKISGNRGIACRKLGYSDIEDDKEDESYDGRSESEGGSLGGFIVSGSDSLEAESNSDDFSSEEQAPSSDVDLDDVLSNIRRERNAKQWEYEADMLASFGKDYQLCMKAVCAIYRQQTLEEKSIKETILLNSRGFNTIDAKRGSLMAEFLLDGDPHGPLKKSAQELERYDPQGLDYCYKLATRYSKQLFTIYQNKEDPYFLPS